MTRKSINARFRGDGGPEYEGPDRRRKERRNAIEIRIIRQIRDEVELAIARHVVDKHNSSGRGKTTLEIRYKSVGGREQRPGFDPDTVREEIIDKVVADIGAQLAIDATNTRGIKPRKREKR